MFEIKIFDNWIEDEKSGKYGSGASEKVWLINPNDGSKGLFKYPKIKSDGGITGEYYAEKIASELGFLLNINCAKVDIGKYHGRLGSMSYNFTNENEILIEGINFIQEKYPNYDRDKFIDDVENIKYSVQMLETLNINISDIFCMIIFDTLIGNSDRHHSNWGYITCLDNYKSFCPLYDNGSSLCSYVNEVDIKTILKDRNRYNALVDTKSKSCIGWNDIRPIRHFELLHKIRENYYNETIAFVNSINEKITEETIKNILSKFSDEIISSDKKELLLKFIIDRKIKIAKIFDLEVINNE